MDQSLPAPLRPLPILIGALIVGVLTFTSVAAFFAISQRGLARTANPDYTLLAVLGVLGVSELLAYHVALRPMLAKQARETASRVTSDDARDSALAQQFTTRTILAAALLEGWGLFGAVIVLLNAQWPAIAAPLIAATGLVMMVNVRARFERFKEEATGQRAV